MAGPQPIQPARLLAHASRLTDESAESAGSGTRLRRSTSAAYYAVFHAVALGVAGQVAPGAADETRYRFARSVDHGKVRNVCDWVAGRSG